MYVLITPNLLTTYIYQMLSVVTSDVRYYRYIDYHDIIINIVIMI